MEIEPEQRAADLCHGSGSDRIAYKSGPEEPQMPPVQLTLHPFSPNTNGVKQHGKIDENDSKNKGKAHKDSLLYFSVVTRKVFKPRNTVDKALLVFLFR
jgi:hypothetical protein